jgi:hypothetical protein
MHQAARHCSTGALSRWLLTRVTHQDVAGAGTLPDIVPATQSGVPVFFTQHLGVIVSNICEVSRAPHGCCF